tara:strand:+ start:12984 stop:13133 length:150 start_codon:yes stop_codon:yes gene_type:complete
MAVSAMLGFCALAMGDYPSISWLHILGQGVAVAALAADNPQRQSRSDAL